MALDALIPLLIEVEQVVGEGFSSRAQVERVVQHLWRFIDARPWLRRVADHEMGWKR